MVKEKKNANVICVLKMRRINKKKRISLKRILRAIFL